MSVKCSNIKLRDHVIVESRPCKVAEIISNQNEEIELKLLDIFRFKSCNVKYSSNDILEVPKITKIDFQLIDVSYNGMILLMKENGSTIEMKFPEGQFGNEILDVMDSKYHMVCTLLEACNEVAVCSTKSVVNVMKAVRKHFSSMWAKIDEFRKKHNMENNKENRLHIQTLIPKENNDAEMTDIQKPDEKQNNEISLNTSNENEKSNLLLDINIIKSRLSNVENDNSKSKKQHISHKQNIMELKRQNMKRNIIIRGRHVPQEKHQLIRKTQKVFLEKYNVHVPSNEISQIHHLPPMHSKGPKRVICGFKTLTPGSPFDEILKRSEYEKKLIAQKKWEKVRNPNLHVIAEMQSSYDDVSLMIAAKILKNMGQIKRYSVNRISGKVELCLLSNKMKSVSNEQELFELFDDEIIQELIAKDETGRLGKNHLEHM